MSQCAPPPPLLCPLLCSPQRLAGVRACLRAHLSHVLPLPVLCSCHFGHVVEEEDSSTSGSEVALEGGGVGEEGGGDTAPTGSKGCAKASGGRCRRMQRSTVQMLLCRTQLGRVCDMGTAVNPALTRAPQGFDSVSGRTDAAGGTRMWALYSNAHCYTAYVVTLSLCVPCSVLPASVSCCRRPGAM